jgi:dienelactone hydrolase
MKAFLQFFIARFYRIKNFLLPYWKKFLRWLRHFTPEKHTRTGSIRGVLLIVLLIATYSGWYRIKWGHGNFLDILIAIGITLIIALIASLVLYFLLGLLRKANRRFTSIILGLILAMTVASNIDPGPFMVIPLGLMLLGALIGGAIAVMSHPNFRQTTWVKKILISLLLVVSIGAIGYFVYWFLQRGDQDKVVQVDEELLPDFPTLELSDPSQAGSYVVKSLTYGHGDDLRRPEFGEEADLTTPTVNGRPFVGKLKGWRGKLRNRFWGFDRSELPLNGRVWYPEGAGPFPLVLIVHGNHSMRDFSDPGYAYLGEFLASKGYIMVSIDQNFINGDWTKNYGKENDARGWLLLEHLKVWRDWNQEADNPFFQKVDMDNLSLMGHSRGGEAVCVAAAFNRLDHYPDDARVKFDYDFNIQSIVSIAQVDGQYLPTFQPTPLEDINFLLLHGSHDSDVSSFSGDKQYKRIAFSGEDYYLKTSLYIYRANHGQFNTVWGDTDSGPPYGNLLNRAELISGEDQRTIGKVYIGAFLDLTLKDQKEYLPLFKDYRYGRHWLPDTYYINRFADARTTYISDYDEDIDVTTISLKGGKAEAAHYTNWKEKDIANRRGNSRRLNQVLYFGWKYELPEKDSTAQDSLAKDIPKDSLFIQDTAYYQLTLPPDWPDQVQVDSNATFTFSVAQVDATPSKPLELDKSDTQMKEEEEEEEEEKEEKEKKKNQKQNQEEKNEEEDAVQNSTKVEEKKEKDSKKKVKPLFFTIVMQDSTGREVRFNLRDYAAVLPPFKAKFTRVKPFEKRFSKSSEPILQTFSIPLSEVRKQNPDFDIQQLQLIRYQFDQSKSGVIYLDEIGFRN